MRVPSELDGERADKVVAVLAGVSRAAARAACDEGRVTADGEVVAARQRLAAGTAVGLPEFQPEPGLQPEDVPLEVVFSDENLAVIDKAAGMVVHPGAGDTGPTLAAAVLHRWPHVRGVGDEDRWGIVHRLDRDTSGLIVVALDHDSFLHLRSQFKARSVTRSYLALLDGTLEAPRVTVDAPIGRDPRRPRRMSLVGDGRRAVTHFERVASWPEHTLVAARLETGRTHQIRVHAASVGAAVAGDGLYGKRAERRMFLHATALGFVHPETGRRVELSSPLPPDLLAWLDELGDPVEGEVP